MILEKIQYTGWCLASQPQNIVKFCVLVGKLGFGTNLTATIFIFVKTNLYILKRKYYTVFVRKNEIYRVY